MNHNENSGLLGLYLETPADNTSVAEAEFWAAKGTEKADTLRTTKGLEHIVEAKRIHQWHLDRLLKAKEEGATMVWGRKWDPIDVDDEIAYQMRVAKSKDIAINALNGEGNYKNAKDMINEWRDSHVLVKDWIDSVGTESAAYKKRLDRGFSSLEHDTKWIQNYDEALEELENLYIGKW